MADSSGASDTVRTKRVSSKFLRRDAPGSPGRLRLRLGRCVPGTPGREAGAGRPLRPGYRGRDRAPGEAGERATASGARLGGRAATAANHRYLDALAVVDDRARAIARSTGSRSPSGMLTTGPPAGSIPRCRATSPSLPPSSAASTRSRASAIGTFAPTSLARTPRPIAAVYEAPERNVGIGRGGRVRRGVAGARSDCEGYVN